MPRFYFHLKSKEARIPDDSGKDFDTLNDACKHGLKLIDKIYCSMLATMMRTSGK